jgi:hypothetical protein
VVGPPVRWVGRRVERRVRRAVPDLPEPPWWVFPVLLGAAFVSAILVEDRNRCDRAEPSASVERGTTSANGDAVGVVEALGTLDVEVPPVPSQEDVRAAHRRRALETHPDQGGDAEEFKDVQEAWEAVAEREELSGSQNDGEVTQES